MAKTVCQSCRSFKLCIYISSHVVGSILYCLPHAQKLSDFKNMLCPERVSIQGALYCNSPLMMCTILINKETVATETITATGVYQLSTQNYAPQTSSSCIVSQAGRTLQQDGRSRFSEHLACTGALLALSRYSRFLTSCLLPAHTCVCMGACARECVCVRAWVRARVCV